MALSKPAPRKHIHTRDIKCMGFERDDGLWDIEGRLTDTKTYSFENHDRGGIAAGEPIHDMLIRLTLTGDMVVEAAEAYTESSPFSLCGEVTDAFSRLVGLKIGPGWRKAVEEVMGGVHGCTHLRDLLMGPIAVTAFQTIYPARKKRGNPGPGKKSPLIDSCYAFRSSGPVVKARWPEFYEEPESGPIKAGEKKAG
ncbi:MAG: hypothetical protein COW30_01745 [Rhodospirillales bacterium CG15_BIG_FIL_POST_REV_8_21_14_020_66_15]|nr:MAG: hypothetical protein COW30_01745 [Rhodospirillales bacterium CG15_BIG_FIL_POST_REV_8_21_14_020_66_15]